MRHRIRYCAGRTRPGGSTIDLRAVFYALRYIVRSGAHWRMMANDLPPWSAVYQQTRRWLNPELVANTKEKTADELITAVYDLLRQRGIVKK